MREIAEATRQIGNMELTEMVVALMGAKDAVPYNAFSELIILTCQIIFSLWLVFVRMSSVPDVQKLTLLYIDFESNED